MLLQKGAEVTIVASGQPLAFLKLTFPELTAVKSTGIKVTYPESGSMALKMALSAPGFLTEIFKEHRWLEQFVKENKVDAVISDNRFGFWSNRVPSIYITHQVLIRLPGRMKVFEPLMYRLHGQFICRYTECWIPDAEGEPNLSGDLSHKYSRPGNAFYIGPLTRFLGYQYKAEEEDLKFQSDLLVILSGPEPQRSILEKIIHREIEKEPGMKVTILQGKPKNWGTGEERNGTKVYSHLEDHQIARLIRNARQIVCRPGYSTVMDLAILKRRALLVPTPGQTEQEYLGRYLSEKGWFRQVSQEKLSIEEIMAASRKETLSLPDFHAGDLLEERIIHLIDSIKK